MGYMCDCYLHTQVDVMEAELAARQAETREAYDALQCKEEEVARLQACSSVFCC